MDLPYPGWCQNEREVELHNILEFGVNPSVSLLMAWEKRIFRPFSKSSSRYNFGTEGDSSVL